MPRDMDIPGNKDSIYTCEKILPVNQRCEKIPCSNNKSLHIREKILPVNQRCEKKIPCSNDKNNHTREKILPINQQCKKIPYSNVRVSRHANPVINKTECILKIELRTLTLDHSTRKLLLFLLHILIIVIPFVVKVPDTFARWIGCGDR